MPSLVSDKIMTKSRGVTAVRGLSGDIVGIDWRIAASRK